MLAAAEVNGVKPSAHLDARSDWRSRPLYDLQQPSPCGCDPNQTFEEFLMACLPALFQSTTGAALLRLEPSYLMPGLVPDWIG